MIFKRPLKTFGCGRGLGKTYVCFPQTTPYFNLKHLGCRLLVVIQAVVLANSVNDPLIVCVCCTCICRIHYLLHPMVIVKTHSEEMMHLFGLQPNAKSRMKELQQKARQSLETQNHAIYKRPTIQTRLEMASNQKWN